MKKTLIYSLLFFGLLACGQNKMNNRFNLFSIQQDKELGGQVANEIASNPQEYPILDSARNAKAYQFLYEMRDKILNSGNVQHKDDFKWQLRIIKDDNTKNAFCTPGGYIYVYTGLMKFLDAEDQLAGVLAHEIAHADYRHSTRQMTKMYGVQVLLDILSGNRAALKQITAGLIGLRFSRSHETEADNGSVKYLCPTHYNAAGGAMFFKKIQELGSGSTPEFLSTHPSPANRVENFYSQKVAFGCQGEETYETRYQNFLKTLP